MKKIVVLLAIWCMPHAYGAAQAPSRYVSASMTPYYWSSQGNTYLLLGKEQEDGHGVWTDFSAQRIDNDEQIAQEEHVEPSFVTATRAGLVQTAKKIVFNEPLISNSFYISVIGDFHIYPKKPSKPYRVAYFQPINKLLPKDIALEEQATGQKAGRIAWHFVNAQKLLEWVASASLGSLHYPGLDAPFARTYKQFLLHPDVQAYLQKIIELGRDKQKRMAAIFTLVKELLDKHIGKDWDELAKVSPQDYKRLSNLRQAALDTESSKDDFMGTYWGDYGNLADPAQKKAFSHLITQVAPPLLVGDGLTQQDLERLKKELQKIDAFNAQDTKEILDGKLTAKGMELKRLAQLEREQKQRPKKVVISPTAKTPRRGAMTSKRPTPMLVEEGEIKREEAFTPAVSHLKKPALPAPRGSQEHEKNIMKDIRAKFLAALAQEDLQEMEKIAQKAAGTYARFKNTSAKLLEDHLLAMNTVIAQITELQAQAAEIPRPTMELLKEDVLKKAKIEIELPSLQEIAEQERKEKRRYMQLLNNFYNALSKKDLEQIRAALEQAKKEFAMISAMTPDVLAGQLAAMHSEYAAVAPVIEAEQYEEITSNFSQSLGNNDLKGMQAALEQAEKMFPVFTSLPKKVLEGVIANMKKKIETSKKSGKK